MHSKGRMCQWLGRALHNNALEYSVLVHSKLNLCPPPFQDLVKSHLMYAVREEVEVLKEQIKELIEKNSQLEQENNLLKTLASPEQLAQFQAQLQTGSPPATTQPQGTTQSPAQPASQGSGPTA